MTILILLLPMILVLWLVIRLGSPGPAIFTQTRVGKGQAPFTLYKFRTMKRDTASVGTHEVSISAVTKAGKFLRRTKLDELPQAVNLLRGEMTLVGPRPCLPVQEELVNARSALGIFAMKPGITGYAQVREIDMSRPQELARSDYIYMKVQSLAINFKIILQTAFGRGRGDRVVS
jgi:lipopolysaccharide/colanic/teichoic acid biosynthesis glycosyltransferase